MGVDIKFPIGLMFSILGVLISIYGFATNSNIEMYKKSLGVNVNIGVGIFMVVFGVVMLLLTRNKKKSEPEEKK